MNLSILLHILTTALALIIAVLGIFNEQLDKKFKHVKLVILICLIIAFSLTVYNILETSAQEKYSGHTGFLSGELKNESIIYPSLSYNGAAIIFASNTSRGHLMGDLPLSLWIENEQLKVSTTVRDRDGNVIAELEANEWQLNANLFFRRNFDDRALEVIDNKGDVVLQIEFDGEAVRVFGIFYNEDGSGHYIGPIENGVAFGTIKPNDEVNANISKMFNYPADLHPGERL